MKFTLWAFQHMTLPKSFQENANLDVEIVMNLKERSQLEDFKRRVSH